MSSAIRPQGAIEAEASRRPLSVELSAEFRVIFDRDYAYVWHSLRRLGVAEADCDDVANEVFVAVHKQFDRYDPARASRPWLFAFCARFASDYRRLARHRYEATSEGEGTLTTSNDPETEALRREANALLLAALDALDDERRQVFVLHEMDELPIPEVARVLAIPVGTAYTRLRSARQEFTASARRLQARGLR